MMPKYFPKHLSVILLMLALVLGACNANTAPETSDVSTDTEADTAVEEAEAAEEADAEMEKEAEVVEEEPQAEEEADAEMEADEDDSQDVVKEVVEESQAAQATELEGGTTIVSEEEVTSPRNNLGGEYRSVGTSDAVSFHPYITTDTGSSGYQGLVYTGGLLRLDEQTLEYIPNMAESYTIAEDGLTFTFKLREGMLWSDGMPITAQDFKWTFDQMTDPANEFPYLSQIQFVTSYEALDDYTIQASIDEVYAPALGQISGLITPLPRHIWEDLDWGDPETNPEINSPSVVSGPYKLAEWSRDEFAIFEANENYWYHGAPNIETSIVEIVPDQDIAYQKLKTGESDTGPITPENLDEARQLENITVYEWWPAAAQWSYIGLNMREGYPTADINLRHALSYAIDKQTMTDAILLGQGKRLCSVFPETSWVYNPDVPCYDYNVDQALAEFAEAGYTYDADSNIMLDENGEQLTLRLIYGPNTSQTLELIAVSVQDYLLQVGVNLEIQALEWSSFLETKNTDNPDWDLFIGSWRATIEPQIMFTIWEEASIPQLNSVAYINKEVDALFYEAGGTYDTDFRREKYQQIQQIIANESPYIFLFYNKAWGGLNNRVQGIETTPLGISWNREDWFIAEEAVP